jgi:PleD family two-component response regulator
MSTVLWIDQNTFASSLIEKVFKKKNLPFYSVASVEDFSYIVNDLSPKVIVVDGATVEANPEAFKAQYMESLKMQQTPFIFLEVSNDLSYIKEKRGEIKRPFDPFNIPDEIDKILSLQ